MNKPFTEWKCDVCGQMISSVDEGYVIWRDDEERRPVDFKVIHQGKCDIKSYSGSMDIKTFLGDSGREWLLSFLSVGAIKRNLGEGTMTLPSDMDAFIDFFRRMQTPYYEEARTKFSQENVLEYHHDDNEVGPYLQDSLQKIIEM